MGDYRDEADAAEDLERASDVLSPETPEADGLEQSTEMDPAAHDRPDHVGEAPEADALDQHRPVAADDEDGERR